MSRTGYNQFCPIAKACEILQPRWTLLILSEMWSGSTRFNDIGRGVPGLSPTLLSRRLREMEGNGLVIRRQDARSGHIGYETTEMAQKLEPVVHALGAWAHENIDCEVSLQTLDSRLLMWNVRRKIRAARFPKLRTVIQFIFPDQRPDLRHYWLIARPDCETDLCVTDPGFEVDLFVESPLKAFTSVWMGWSSLDTALADGDIFVSGDAALAGSIRSWMVLSSFAGKTSAKSLEEAV
jgi:DNA-binding HxlR family transcriptional regulator